MRFDGVKRVRQFSFFAVSVLSFRAWLTLPTFEQCQGTCDRTSRSLGIECFLEHLRNETISRCAFFDLSFFSSTVTDITALCSQACITSAGFEVDQPVVNYRIRVEIPPELEQQVFPFVGHVLGSERKETPLSQGTKSTLYLLLSSRRYFILVRIRFLASLSPLDSLILLSLCSITPPSTLTHRTLLSSEPSTSSKIQQTPSSHGFAIAIRFYSRRRR